MSRTVLARIVTALTLAGLLSLLPSSAGAYNLEAAKWCGQPPPHNCCAYLYAQVSPYMYTQDVNGWNNGRGAWNSSAAPIYIYTTSVSAISLNDVWDSGAQWLGVSLLYWNNSNHCFTSTTSTLNAYLTSQPYVPWQWTQEAAAHELGHVFGLDHVGGCALMNIDSNVVWNTCGIDQPTQDEDNGISALY